MTTSEQWRTTTGLRTALVWLLSTSIVATIVLAITVMHHEQVVDDYYHDRASYGATRDADRLLGVAAIGFLTVLVATAVVFIVWMWRSAKNNELLDHIRPRYTPGWSIGGWFIPFANLVIPVRIMHDLWQGSDPETRELPRLARPAARRRSSAGGGASTSTQLGYFAHHQSVGPVTVLDSRPRCSPIVVVRTITEPPGDGACAAPVDRLRRTRLVSPTPRHASTTATGTAPSGPTTSRRPVSDDRPGGRTGGLG